MNIGDILRDFGALHFLRPAWLFALLALPLLVAWWRRRRHRHSGWQNVVDPHLLARLLDRADDSRSRMAVGVALLAYALAVLALAGPSWRQVAQPLWQSRSPLVVALDLSSAAMAGDLPPSRLAQARAKLSSLLRARNGGPVALVAFAGDAFTVAPLTDDAANVGLFLDALQPDVMPVDGQRADRAIDWSVELLQRAHAVGSDIVLLTDHADARAIEAAARAAARGHRVSAIGLGTATGAAYRRPGGGLATARLDAGSLRRLATSGRGRYATLTVDDADLRTLGVLEVRSSADADRARSDNADPDGRAWQDEGYWLLPPLLLLVLFAFRRRSGTVGAVAAAVLCLGLPAQPAHAVDLWRRPDQAAHARLQEGNAAYRRGDYAQATRQYQGLDSATAHYNRGNALAKAGQYPQAIAAYDDALRRQPGMADALANKRAVEEAMKRKPSPDQQAKQSPRPGQNGQSGQPGPAGPPQQAQQQAQQNPSQASAPQSSASDRQAPPQGQPPPRPSSQSPSPAEPADEQAQQAADRAQRERMQRALQQRQAGAEQSETQERPRPAETAEQRERRLANEAWLKRVPDDPGGLLRAKFRLEYERRMLQGRIEE